MFNIGQFFKKIQGKYNQEILLRSIIREAVQSQGGVVLPLESINYKNGVIILTGLTQTARSQIFIKKQAIIGQINSRQNTKAVIDIR